MKSMVQRKIRMAVVITFFAQAGAAFGVAGAAGVADSGNAAAARAGDEINVQGTVEFVGVEGGFWGVIGADGKRYDLVNLPKEFQQQGLGVKFTGRLRPDQISFHMWGVVVEIISVERLGTGK